MSLTQTLKNSANGLKSIPEAISIKFKQARGLSLSDYKAGFAKAANKALWTNPLREETAFAKAVSLSYLALVFFITLQFQIAYLTQVLIAFSAFKILDTVGSLLYKVSPGIFDKISTRYNQKRQAQSKLYRHQIVWQLMKEAKSIWNAELPRENKPGQDDSKPNGGNPDDKRQDGDSHDGGGPVGTDKSANPVDTTSNNGNGDGDRVGEEKQEYGGEGKKKDLIGQPVPEGSVRTTASSDQNSNPTGRGSTRKKPTDVENNTEPVGASRSNRTRVQTVAHAASSINGAGTGNRKVGSKKNKVESTSKQSVSSDELNPPQSPQRVHRVGDATTPTVPLPEAPTIDNSATDVDTGTSAAAAQGSGWNLG